MSKTISGAMTTHLGLTTTTLASIWSITRTDGNTFFLTDHDANIVFGGDTYVAMTGYERTVIANDSSMRVDNLDVSGILGDTSSDIQEDDLVAGLFDFAEINIRVVDWTDPDTTGDVKMRRGWIGEVIVDRQGGFRTELRGLTQALSQRIIEIFQPECRADLGDARCTIPILAGDNDTPTTELQRSAVVVVSEFYVVPTAGGSGQEQYENRIYEVTTAGTTAVGQPTYDTVIDNPTTDGTAVLTARNAFVRDAVVATVTDRRIFTITVVEARAVDDWFNGGLVVFESGSNAGQAIEIKDWTQSTSTIELFMPTKFTITIADALRLYAGCDFRKTTCRNKFVIANTLNFSNGNVVNMRAEPHLPGLDDILRYPDAR